MSKFLYLVRHGKYDSQNYKVPAYDTFPFHLNPSGVSDIETLGNMLNHVSPKISAIYSSPFVRTHETAEILANKLNLEITLKEGLQETTRDEHMSRDFEAMYQRVSGVIKPLIENMVDNSACIIVSHRDPLRIFIHFEKGLDVNSLIKEDSCGEKIPMGSCLKLIYDTNELTIVEEFYCPEDLNI